MKDTTVYWSAHISQVKLRLRKQSKEKKSIGTNNDTVKLKNEQIEKAVTIILRKDVHRTEEDLRGLRKKTKPWINEESEKSHEPWPTRGKKQL